MSNRSTFFKAVLPHIEEILARYKDGQYMHECSEDCEDDCELSGKWLDIPANYSELFDNKEDD